MFYMVNLQKIYHVCKVSVGYRKRRRRRRRKVYSGANAVN